MSRIDLGDDAVGGRLEPARRIGTYAVDSRSEPVPVAAE